MDEIKIIVPYELPTLNEFIAAINKHRMIGAKMKKDADHLVYVSAFKHRGHGIKPPYHFTFHWFLKNSKVDYDNIAAGKKWVLDGLQLAKVIEQDSQKFVAGFSDEFSIDKNYPRCEITIKHKDKL